MNEKEKISLKHYIDKRFEDFKNYMDIQFCGIKQSTRLAQENLDAKLENMNEFRSSMKDQTARFVTREELLVITEKYTSDIALLREANAEAKGKASQNSVNVAYIIAFIGIILGVLGLIIKI